MHHVPGPSRPAPLLTRLLTEYMMPLKEAGRRLRPDGGRPVHVTTLHRWRLTGASGVRLEAVLVGGRWMTSLEAVDRFVSAINLARSRACPAPPLPTRRRAGEIGRRLEAEGL